MSETYIVINSGQQIYYFDEKTFFDHINQVNKSDRIKINWIFLESFPLPNNDTSIDSGNGRDSKGRPYGRFCPFGNERSWPSNALLVMRLSDKTIFVPEKVIVTKVVEEYGILANTDATPSPVVTKASAKKASAKKAPSRRSRK